MDSPLRAITYIRKAGQSRALKLMQQRTFDQRDRLTIFRRVLSQTWMPFISTSSQSLSLQCKRASRSNTKLCRTASQTLLTLSTASKTSRSQSWSLILRRVIKSLKAYSRRPSVKFSPLRLTISTISLTNSYNSKIKWMKETTQRHRSNWTIASMRNTTAK